ncbi:MAG: TIGR03087 family PEP-CTERM/XrtA system glycosyltransferase [Gammaproteobacteria bacterium]|nr:TIGR03087 family PEP-CTERM/XrtA system glycosyltransferase [Gammaproteobacteria bacterium]
MEELLFLAHRIPYPPNKGDKIRSYHILKHLARSYRVHLGAFVDDPDDWKYRDKLEEICASTCLLPLHPLKARARSLTGLLSNSAMSVSFFRDHNMQQWVNARLEQDSLQRIFVFSSPVAQYVMNSQASSCRRVVDFVDVDSDKWKQYAQHKRWPASWLYRREAERLLAFEKNVATLFDASIFVSSAEAALFRRLVPEVSARTGFLDNGVDRDYFSPERNYDNPCDEQAKIIVFTGAMDYWANVHAVQWFALHVLPRVREAVPAAKFVIVGARPASEVQRLASVPGVEVTGAVPDVRPYLAHAYVAVAPLRIARGVQNKVLEAMAMAKAVVASPAAVEGIEFNNPAELRVADSEQQFAEQVIQFLCDDKPAVARDSRQWISDRYDWNNNLSRVGGLLECPSPSGYLHGIAGRQAANTEEKSA